MKYAKIRIVFALLLALCSSQLVLGESNEMLVRCVAFYNLENLFDTIHD